MPDGGKRRRLVVWNADAFGPVVNARSERGRFWPRKIAASPERPLAFDNDEGRNAIIEKIVAAPIQIRLFDENMLVRAVKIHVLEQYDLRGRFSLRIADLWKFARASPHCRDRSFRFL